MTTLLIAAAGLTARPADAATQAQPEAPPPAPTSTPAVTAAAPAPQPAPQPPPPPYSLPWQLRPAGVATVVRSDTSLALYKTKDMAGNENPGSTVASTLLAAYKVSPSFAPLARLALVQNQEPGEALGSGTAFVNPILGLLYGHKLGGDFRMSAFAGATVPVGMGGDKKRTMDETAAAAFRGIAARSAMDNAMFAINYFVGIGGFDVAYVAHKLTVQAEVTALQLFRVRHEDVDVDKTRTNLTLGLHAGYFLASWLSAAGEIRHQRWLSTPAVVAMTPALRDTTTFAVGPRFHFKLSNTTWLRPGLSYSRALDDPLAGSDYNIVQLDVPVIF